MKRITLSVVASVAVAAVAVTGYVLTNNSSETSNEVTAKPTKDISGISELSLRIEDVRALAAVGAVGLQTRQRRSTS